MNCIPASQGFLEELRKQCDQYSSVLIFDEVMTGFRVALGGAQAHYGIKPDLSILGKIIGGGMPVGAFGGRSEIMDRIAPDGLVYQAGTLSGNPVAMAAGLRTLQLLCEPGVYDKLSASTDALISGIRAEAESCGVALTSNHAGAMFGLFFSDATRVETFSQVMDCDNERFNRFFHGMLEQGVYLAPSAFEAGFMSLAHSEDDIARTIAAAGRCFKKLD